MPGVGYDHGTSPPTISCIDQLSVISGIGDDTFNRGRFRADDRNHTIRRDDITETYINESNIHREFGAANGRESDKQSHPGILILRDRVGGLPALGRKLTVF